MTEFEMIAHHFARPAQATAESHVVVDIGDDAAVLNIPPQQQLVVATDTLVSDIHFFSDADPYTIGYKSLAVNLSDLAAMGATPYWFLCAITLPADDEEWLAQFTAGLFAIANQFKVKLIGGDTTRGPLSITIQALGLVPQGCALLRSQAKVGDHIFVTGTLGDAGCALAYLKEHMTTIISKKDLQPLLTKLTQPYPRVHEGIALRAFASAAIDISDGLVSDLNHILQQSHVGAEIIADHLPLSAALKHHVSEKDALQFALSGGDDYELCFTVSEAQITALKKYFANDTRLASCTLTDIGRITADKKLTIKYSNGNFYDGKISGFQHF